MKLDLSKEWCASRAEIEGDSEVGAGTPPIHWRTAKDSDLSADGFVLGQFVELARRDRGWSVRQLAASAGIEAGDVLRIEQDHCHRTATALDTVRKLAGIFGVSAEKLFELGRMSGERTTVLREAPVSSDSEIEEAPKALSTEERQTLRAYFKMLSNPVG